MILPLAYDAYVLRTCLCVTYLALCAGEEWKAEIVALREKLATELATSPLPDRLHAVQSIRRWMKREKAFLRSADVVEALQLLGVLPAKLMCQLCSQDGRKQLVRAAHPLPHMLPWTHHAYARPRK